jgi:gluconate 2-dehydrogenase gamma chain
MSVSRRRFLQLLGAFGISQAVNIERGQDAPGGVLPLAPEYNPPPQPRILGNRLVAYTFFTAPETRFIESVVARLIPTDDLGPGALEAGVSYFIDQQLQTSYGLAAKMYMQGPWGSMEGEAEASDELQNEVSSTQEQGYQLPVTPQELYQLCIAALETHAEETYGALFANMTASQQDAMLTALENGDITVEPLPPSFLSSFWTMLLANTKQGFFADPAYGGNGDKVGWRLVGFPGVAAAYKGVIQAYYNVPYLVDPVSLVDIQNGTIAMDDSGHALHISATTGEVIKGTGHEH